MSTEASIQRGKGIVANPEFILAFFLAASLGVAGTITVIASFMTQDLETHEWTGLTGVIIVAVLTGLAVATRFLGERLLVGIIALAGLLAGIGAILVVGYLWAAPTGDGGHGNPLVAGLIGLLILGLGVYSMRRRELGLSYQPKNRNRRGQLLGGLGVFGIGVLNGSLSAGTGLFLTLWLVRWFGFDYKRAVAHTLVLVGMFWNGAGALTLGILGSVHWLWLPVLLAGSLIGGYLGAHLSIKKGNRWIKRGFEIITLLVGFKLVFA